MEKILISACFLGERVRYDGNGKQLGNDIITQWRQQDRLVMICPEVAGGLAVPRPPAEIQQDGSVLTKTGIDVSQAFEQGAQTALRLCQQFKIRYALLKAASPSCGSDDIYDGSFTGTKKSGEGKTVSLLRAHGVTVFSEHTLENLVVLMAEADRQIHV